jgi:hypothetical protein
MESCADEKITNLPITTQDEFDFQIKGAAARNGKRRHAEPETCTICLEEIAEKAVVVPCNHLSFDFICLAQWLQENTTCPLCKVEVQEVQYDWRSATDYKTYRPPEKRVGPPGQSPGRTGHRRRGHTRQQRDIGWEESTTSAQTGTEDAALTRRRGIYRDQAFSLHVGTNRVSQYKDFAPSDFTASAELQSQARMFLRRELRVFDFLESGRATGPRGNRDYLVEYILAILKLHEPKAWDGHPENLIADFLGRADARLLLHELDAWLRSPYTSLEGWDRHVQYHTAQSYAKDGDERSAHTLPGHDD